MRRAQFSAKVSQRARAQTFFKQRGKNLSALVKCIDCCSFTNFKPLRKSWLQYVFTLLFLKLDCKIFTPEEQETTLYYIVMNIEQIKEPNVIGELYRLKRLIFNVDNSNKSDSYKLYRDIVNTPPATVKTVRSNKQIKIQITGRGFISKEYVYNDENFYF